MIFAGVCTKPVKECLYNLMCGPGVSVAPRCFRCNGVLWHIFPLSKNSSSCDLCCTLPYSNSDCILMNCSALICTTDLECPDGESHTDFSYVKTQHNDTHLLHMFILFSHKSAPLSTELCTLSIKSPLNYSLKHKISVFPLKTMKVSGVNFCIFCFFHV